MEDALLCAPLEKINLLFSIINSNTEGKTMGKRNKKHMTKLDDITMSPGKSLIVNLNGNVQVELRVTPLGQPEIYCDHTHIVRLFRDHYEPNETC